MNKMSLEVCASTMLSFVREVLQSTTDFGSLTIRELRNKYSKTMGIKSLSHEEKETFRAIVDQAVMEHKVEKEELQKTNTSESPLVLKKKPQKLTSDTEDSGTELKGNNTDESPVKQHEENHFDDQAGHSIPSTNNQDDDSNENKIFENDTSVGKENKDGEEFYIKKKKKKHKGKHYTVDKDSPIRGDEGKTESERRQSIPRIKLVRDYSAKPKSDSASDIDEFINSVVKAATVDVVSPAKRDNGVSHSVDISCHGSDSGAAQQVLAGKSEQDSHTCFETSKDSVISSTSLNIDCSDSDDEPLAKYCRSSNANKLNSGASHRENVNDDNNSNPAKKFKLSLSLGDDSASSTGALHRDDDGDDDDSNLSDSSDDLQDQGDSNQSGSKKRKRANNSSTKKTNNEDQHIQKYKRYMHVAGLRFSYKMFEGCNTVKAKVQKIKDALKAAGIEGRPTLEKCKKLKKMRERERELASLDKSNIIGTEGRPKRNTRSASITQEEETQPSETLLEVKKTFSRLKGIIDSEDSD